VRRAQFRNCAVTLPNKLDAMARARFQPQFVRMVAEAALEDMAEGKTPAEVTPFWRVIASQDKIAKKLALDPDWLDQQRALEAS